MRRYDIFSCTCTISHTHTHLMLRYYVMISSLALAHRRDATLWFLLLHLHNLVHIHTHTLDATLWYLLFHLHNLVHKHTHTRDARLWYVLLHLHNLAHTLDATLWFLALHLHNLARTHTHIHTHTFDATIWYLLLDRIYQWIFRHNLAKRQLTNNMKKGWKTCRLNSSSSNDPSTSFMKWQKVRPFRTFLYIEVKNAGVSRVTMFLGFLLLCHLPLLAPANVLSDKSGIHIWHIWIPHD